MKYFCLSKSIKTIRKCLCGIGAKYTFDKEYGVFNFNIRYEKKLDIFAYEEGYTLEIRGCKFKRIYIDELEKKTPYSCQYCSFRKQKICLDQYIEDNNILDNIKFKKDNIKLKKGKKKICNDNYDNYDYDNTIDFNEW